MVISKTGLGFVLVSMLVGALACDVESTAEGPEGTGDDDTGDDDEPRGADADAQSDAGPAEVPLACPEGVTVVLSDFISTQIALSSLTGQTEVESLISTGSSETDGLAFALSGDVGLPGAAPESGRVVLLDRFGTNVITWVDPESAEVLGQLPVGTGFESNPQDYVEIGDDLALVSRMEQNGYPGNEDFDRGGDVLVVDTEQFQIVDAIELPIEEDLPPRPAAMTRLGEIVLVNLERYSLDFSETGVAMWAAISIADQELEWVEPLPGLKDCGRPTLSPDGSELLVACTGRIDIYGAIEDIDQSALVVFDPSENPPVEVARYAAEDLVGEPIQDNVAFVDDEHVLFKTQTPFGGTTNNRAFSLNLSTGDVTELLEARPDPSFGGKGVVYGAIRCAPGCSPVCLMTDSDRGVLQRFRLVDGVVEGMTPVRVEDSVGLPPIGLTHR